jgi:hypothetical protein
MPRKRPTPDEIVAKLRRVDVFVSLGKSVTVAVRSIGTTDVTYYLYGRLSRYEPILNSPAGPIANIHPASPDDVGAPKWGIPSRMPLQLEGLDNSPAPCAPVRTVQLISPTSRNLLKQAFSRWRSTVRQFGARPR